MLKKSHLHKFMSNQEKWIMNLMKVLNEGFNLFKKLFY